MSQGQVTNIDVPYPAPGDLQLRLAVGACRVRIAPGAGEAWVAGSYRDPSGALPVRIVQEGSIVRIAHQADWSSMFGWAGGLPTFDLALGKARPFGLVIETGASESELELGGVPVKRLEVKYGAGKMGISFSEPNPEPMTLLDVGSGAGALEISNLANAGFAEMRVEGGAASYRFDFGGRLQRDGNARIQTGVSSVELIVPSATAARIYSDTVIGGIDVGDGFTSRDRGFWTGAAMAGGTPVLSIRATVALGSLKLRTR